MSYEVANEHELLGQFASAGGFDDFTAAVKGSTPDLKSLIVNGASQEVPKVVKDLELFIRETDDPDLEETATTLKALIMGQEVIVITNGMLPDE